MENQTKFQRWLPDEPTEEYCINCKSILRSDWEYCPKCSARNEHILRPQMATSEYILQQKRETARMRAKKDRNNPLGTIFVIALFVLFPLFIILYSINNSNSGSTTSPAETPIVTYAPSKPTTSPLKEHVFSNGAFIKKPSYESICPLTVSVPSGKKYYIYLDYQYAPTRSRDKRVQGNTKKVSFDGDVSFTVDSGRTVSIDVPIGVYKLYYAYGDTWYGAKDRFGPDTVYYTSDDLLEFYTDNSHAYGHTLELWLQKDGNFDADRIYSSSFPD